MAAVLGALALVYSASGDVMSSMPGLDRFAPCPDSPNCVSSLSRDPAHRIEPLRYTASTKEARARLLVVLRELPRVRIVTSEPMYLHAEVTSAVFRFVDDLEFMVADEDKVVHVRSASRVGYYDFGANRRRVEAIRQRFEAGGEVGGEL